MKERIIQIKNDPQIQKLLEERETVRKAKEKLLNTQQNFEKKRADILKQIDAKKAKLKEKLLLGEDDHTDIAREIMELKKSDETVAVTQSQFSSDLFAVYDSEIEGIEEEIRRRVVELLRPIWEEERETKTKMVDSLIARHKSWSEGMKKLANDLGLKVHKGRAFLHVLYAPDVPDIETRRRQELERIFK